MRVVLIGPPASGKSRIGKRVARILDLPFLDTDRLVVAGHGPIPDLFASHGEPHFRSLERAEVVRALGTDAVVSFGGGAVLDAETQHDIASLPVVLLTVQPHAVSARLGNGKRPLVPDLESWIALYERRRDLYARLADHVVDTTDRPTDQIAGEIADWVRAHPAGTARPASTALPTRTARPASKESTR